MSPVNGINNDRQRVISSGNRTQKENTTSKKNDDTSIWQNFAGKNKTQKAKSDEDGDFFTSTMKETANNLAKNDSFYKQDEKGRLVANKTKSVIASLKSSFAKNAKWVGNKLNYAINYLTQGSEGNCGLLSAIQAIGERPDSRKILKEMIKPSEDGKGYYVSFKGKKSGAGSKDKPVFISKQAVANDSTKRRTKNSDLEAAIINQAVKQAVGPPPYNPGQMLTLLTGKKATEISTSKLNSLIANAKTPEAKAKVKKMINSLVGWWGNHAWSIEDYKNGKFILRNPHGTQKREYRSDTPFKMYTLTS